MKDSSQGTQKNWYSEKKHTFRRYTKDIFRNCIFHSKFTLSVSFSFVIPHSMSDSWAWRKRDESKPTNKFDKWTYIYIYLHSANSFRIHLQVTRKKLKSMYFLTQFHRELQHKISLYTKIQKFIRNITLYLNALVAVVWFCWYCWFIVVAFQVCAMCG